MNKVQEHQLAMAKEVDRICKKYNLLYYIDGGTLLGAVRHKGFIPWDDDLDISMPRKDYDQFIAIAQKELNKSYFLQTLETEPNYGLPFAKIRDNNTLYIEEMSKNVDIHNGIFIDIFPIDNLSNNQFRNKLIVNKIILFRLLLLAKQNYTIEANSTIKKIIVFFLNIFSKLIPLKYIKKQIHKTQYKYADKETNYVANFSDVYFDKLILEKKLVRKVCPYQFENTTLMGIEDYDPYLKFYFNDYMTPPPVNERENQHGILKVEFYNEKKKID